MNSKPPIPVIRDSEDRTTDTLEAYLWEARTAAEKPIADYDQRFSITPDYAIVNIWHCGHPIIKQAARMIVCSEANIPRATSSMYCPARTSRQYFRWWDDLYLLSASRSAAPAAPSPKQAAYQTCLHKCCTKRTVHPGGVKGAELPACTFTPTDAETSNDSLQCKWSPDERE